MQLFTLKKKKKNCEFSAEFRPSNVENNIILTGNRYAYKRKTNACSDLLKKPSPTEYHFKCKAPFEPV